jgi:hypothetical protein
MHDQRKQQELHPGSSARHICTHTSSSLYSFSVRGRVIRGARYVNLMSISLRGLIDRWKYRQADTGLGSSAPAVYTAWKMPRRFTRRVTSLICVVHSAPYTVQRTNQSKVRIERGRPGGAHRWQAAVPTEGNIAALTADVKNRQQPKHHNKNNARGQSTSSSRIDIQSLTECTHCIDLSCNRKTDRATTSESREPVDERAATGTRALHVKRKTMCDTGIRKVWYCIEQEKNPAAVNGRRTSTGASRLVRSFL